MTKTQDTLLLSIPHVQCHTLTDTGPVPLKNDCTMEIVQRRKQDTNHHSDKTNTTAVGGLVQVLVKLNECNAVIVLSKTVPCLKSGDRRYVFTAEEKFVGVTVPSKVDDATVAQLESLLRAFCQALIDNSNQQQLVPMTQTTTTTTTTENQNAPEDLTPRTAKRVGAAIEKSSEWLARGLVKSATVVGSGIRKGSEKLQARTVPKAEPTPVSERTLRAIDRSKEVAATAKTTTRAMVEVVETTTQALADEAVLALNSSNNGSKLANSKIVLGAVEIARAGLIAMGNIYEAAIDSGIIVMRDGAQATTDYVRHKHGDEAGDATANTVLIVEDLGQAMHNANCLRPKTVIKSGAIKYVRGAAAGHPNEPMVIVDAKLIQQPNQNNTDDMNGTNGNDSAATTDTTDTTAQNRTFMVQGTLLTGESALRAIERAKNSNGTVEGEGGVNCGEDGFSVNGSGSMVLVVPDEVMDNDGEGVGEGEDGVVVVAK